MPTVLPASSKRSSRGSGCVAPRRLRPQRAGQPAGQGEHQRQRVLGDLDAERAAGIRDDDVGGREVD